MKIFRDLIIRGDRSSLLAMVEAIGASLSNGWIRNIEAEERLRSMTGDDRATYCFACEADSARPAARLFLQEDEGGSLYVSNIVPKDRGKLSFDQYNFVIKEFFDDFVISTKAKDIEAILTSSEQNLDHWLDPSALEKLRQFTLFANKSTGSSNPHDQDRWFAFLTEAHRTRSELDSTTLIRWLTEDDHWGEEEAHELAIEYEFGRGLLSYATSHLSHPVH